MSLSEQSAPRPLDLSKVRHELRTPINHILGYCDILLEDDELPAIFRSDLFKIKLLRANPFDLVLLDLIMPGLDGYQVLTRLKADPTLKHVPVIMISALDQENGISRCIELGAEDYVAKPFSPVFLRARIGASLEKKKLRDPGTQNL